MKSKTYRRGNLKSLLNKLTNIELCGNTNECTTQSIANVESETSNLLLIDTEEVRFQEDCGSLTLI
jgi:hypothetical protein